MGAVGELCPLAEKQSDDQLVYLLECGIALHEAGKYKDSTYMLLKAYDIAEIVDYHSVSRVAGSLLLNEGMIQYKGENFEKVLINAYLAINYLLMGELDEAAVEARRVNDVLYKLKNEANLPFDQNPFARYLSAIIWEAKRNWDSTYIDYKNTYDLAPGFRLVYSDLIWSAKKANRVEEAQKWHSKFKEVSIDPKRSDKDFGEIVFIYQQGQGPQKRPDPGFPRVPRLYPRPTHGVKALINIIPYGIATNEPAVDAPADLQTEMLFSITDTAIKNLNEQYGEIIAKRLAGVATKAVVADQIRQKNKALGDIAWIAMNVADQADLRQWATLPESLQLARKVLKPGRYRIVAQAVNGSGNVTGEKMEEREFIIEPRKKTFITWRSFH